MIEHDDACSVVIDGQCNCKGGKIQTHVHALVQETRGGQNGLYCVVQGCYYMVALKGTPDGNG